MYPRTPTLSIVISIAAIAAGAGLIALFVYRTTPDDPRLKRIILSLAVFSGLALLGLAVVAAERMLAGWI